jgi:hypothetical protein
MRYIKNILISIDQFINTICLGDPDETLSSRVGKARDKNEVFWARVINKIFFWQKNHCKESIEPDEGKDQI